MPHEVEGGGRKEKVEPDLVHLGVVADDHLPEGEGDEREREESEHPFGFDADYEEESEDDFRVADAVGEKGNEEAGDAGLLEGGDDPGAKAVVVIREGIRAVRVANFEFPEACGKEEKAEKEPEGDKGPGFS